MFDKNKIKKLLKLTIGERTNHVLYELLSHYLHDYWVFLKPKIRGVEITDVALIFGDTCILFEVKTRNRIGLHANEDWIKSRLKEGIIQINQRFTQLKNGELEQIRNKWRGIIKWSELGIKYYYGMLVLFHESKPYDPRLIAPEAFSSSTIPIQVISLQDLKELLRFANTPLDFVVYYELRREFSKKYKVLVHDERSIYLAILDRLPELIQRLGSKFPKSKNEEYKDFMIEYTKVIMGINDVSEKSYEKIAASFLIDTSLASFVKKADADRTGKRIGSEEHNYYVKYMEAIAELSRERRVLYGNLWLEQATRAVNSQQIEYITAFNPSRNRSYILIAKPTVANNTLEFLSLAQETMRKDNSLSCLVLSGTAFKIIETHKYWLSLIKEKSMDKIEDDKVIDAITIFIENKKPC